MNKIILAIDASSSAIGYSLMDKNKIYISGTVVLEDAKNKVWDERVPEIIKKFEEELATKGIVKRAEELGCKDLLLNLGYVPANGVDTSTIALSDVQAYMRLKFVYSKLSWNYVPVLDQSWLNALAEFNGWIGSKNDLKNRSTKKLETVKAALSLKGFDPKTVTHVSGAKYNYARKHIDGYAQDCRVPEIMDDEADAIFAGWSFLNEKISDSTLISRTIKKQREKLDEEKYKLNKCTSRCGNIESQIKKLKSEIDLYKLKEKEKHSVVNEKAISNREKEIHKLENEKIELESMIAFHKINIGKLKDK